MATISRLGWLRWLRLVGSFKLYVAFAKEPYKRDDILQRRPIILRSLLTVATPYDFSKSQLYSYLYRRLSSGPNS